MMMRVISDVDIYEDKQIIISGMMGLKFHFHYFAHLRNFANAYDAAYRPLS